MLLLNSNIALGHGLRDNVTNLHFGQTLIIVNSDCLFGFVDIVGINNSFKSINLKTMFYKTRFWSEFLRLIS